MNDQEAYEALLGESITAQQRFLEDNSTLDRSLREPGILSKFIEDQTKGESENEEESDSKDGGGLVSDEGSGEGSESGNSEPPLADSRATSPEDPRRNDRPEG